MALKVGKDTKVNTSYTAKEVMSNDYPELWNTAKELVDYLSTFQSKLDKEITACKNCLPNSFDELNKQEAQGCFSNYIRLRSLYAFSYKLWKLIDKQCRNLAYMENEKDQEGIDEAKEDLQETLNAASTIPFESILDDHVSGLLRLKDMNDRFKEKSILNVFKNWSFGDVIGTIGNNGLLNEVLWRAAVEDVVPDSMRIGELLPDDDMIRIY